MNEGAFITRKFREPSSLFHQLWAGESVRTMVINQLAWFIAKGVDDDMMRTANFYRCKPRNEDVQHPVVTVRVQRDLYSVKGFSTDQRGRTQVEAGAYHELRDGAGRGVDHWNNRSGFHHEQQLGDKGCGWALDGDCGIAGCDGFHVGPQSYGEE